MQITTRHQERIRALQLLYSCDIKKKYDIVDANIACEKFKAREHLGNDTYYFENIVKGVLKKKEDLDNLISNFAIGWTIKRMSFININILRIALFEIDESTPPGVVINEAVELAKEFGDEKSSAFVNGILAEIINNRKVKN
jgi:transcription antitermination protein NusB